MKHKLNILTGKVLLDCDSLKSKRNSTSALSAILSTTFNPESF